MPTAPTFWTLPALGNVGMNWYGSYMVHAADTTFEPNFRLFDWVYEEEAPTPELIERVFNTPEGQAHQSERVWGGYYRTLPVMLPTTLATVVTTIWGCRMNNTTFRKWRTASFGVFFVSWFVHNLAAVCSREKYFLMDWWKNQSFAMDEMKRLRDEQRVREALYATRFVDDPVSEYRLKEWIIADRQH